jgi:hypothetical protein
MSARIIYASLALALVACPVIVRAEDSIYSQCQQTCAGDGLSCVDRCVAAQRAANGGGDSNDQVVGEDGDRIVDREDIENRAAAIEESGRIQERREERFERRR